MPYRSLNLDSDVNLKSLIELFFTDAAPIGEFDEVAPDDLEPPFNELLNHQSHMTVTVEKHHRCPVDVQVLDTRLDEDFYSRKILLTRQSDGLVVQFGIVTIDSRTLHPDIFAEITAQRRPLGRILISHNVLRKVRLHRLFKISAGDELVKHFGVQPGTVVAGRTAVIDCNRSPAIGLLEIVRQ